MLTTGTATGHNDLLNELHNWLVNTVGWTELEYTAGVADTDVATMSLRAPGASSGNEFFFHVTTAANAGNGFYGWSMRASIDYDDSVGQTLQPGVSAAVFLNTWQNDIDYWFYANDRRVIVVAHVNTSYVSAYAGLFLPFALPNEYLKPFYIGGNYTALDAYNVANARNRMIADPGQQTAYYLAKDGVNWRQVANHASSISAFSLVPTPQAIMWPHRTLLDNETAGWFSQGINSLRPNLAGELPHFLCHIYDVGQLFMAGAMEGVYSSPGFGKTSEQVITVAGNDLRQFQNVFRTTPRDFMAIREE